MLNAPLRYTLAMLRFPKVISVEKYVGAFQDHVRSDYPLFSEKISQGYELKVEDGGAQVSTRVEKLWQFSSAERDHALLLGSDFLVLHAGKGYRGHDDFISRFTRAVEAVLRVEGLATLMTAVGYRYIDLVVPKTAEGETLADYLRPWAMPTDVPELQGGISLTDSAYVAGFRTPQGVLRFQALRRPPATLPPELDTPFVRDNGWVEPRPAGEFALLDIDHARVITPSIAVNAGKVADGLATLQAPARELFDKAVTEHAIREWEGRR